MNCYNKKCVSRNEQHRGNCTIAGQPTLCALFEPLKANKEPVAKLQFERSVMPRFVDKMHIDFERYVSSNLNWPIERTGSSYHDERTDGAWKVFKFAKVA